MTRHIFFLIWILALMLVCSPQARALDYIGLPGSTWGQVTHDVDDLVGTGTMGYINQGIDWTKLPGDITFNTFAEFRYRFRGRNKEFYNAYSEAVGLEFKRSPFRLGMDYVWERFPNLEEGSHKVQYYLSWYQGWDLGLTKKIGSLDILGLPGSTWGQVTHDVDDLVGTGTMGYINQGIDWTKLPGDIVFNTFLEFRYRFRSRNHDFFDAYSEAIGMEFKKSPFRLGLDYVFERFPGLNEGSSKIQFYLTWYYDWDLKNKPTAHPE